MKLILFVIIELLLLPFSWLGVILYMGVILLVNRPRGVSGTAYEPYLSRLIWHELGLRPDPAGRRLADHLSASGPLIRLLMLGPTLLAVRLSGYLPTVLQFPPGEPVSLMNLIGVRTEFFDHAVTDSLPEVNQVVILGAGWDTRGHGLAGSWEGTVFEVDAPATHAAKIQAVEAAGLSSNGIRYVAVDFNATPWLEALVDAGFDPTLPTCVIWEGVTMYLEQAAIRDSLRTVAGLAPGSRIAFDYFAAELVEGRQPYSFVGKLIPLGIWLTYGERITSGISMHPDRETAIRQYLANEGLNLEQSLSSGGYYGFALARSAS